MIRTFREQCDICSKFDYCKGYNGLVLCEKCLKKEKQQERKSDSYKDNKNFEPPQNQTSIYDYI